MGYFKKPRLGMGDSSSCGQGQQFYGNVTFSGVKGQCMTPAQYDTCKSTGKIFGSPCTVDSDLVNIASSFLASLLPTSQAPSTAPVAAQSGMSTTTKVALAGGAVLLVALLARR